MQHRINHFLPCAVAILMLTACGGGGGAGSTAAESPASSIVSGSSDTTPIVVQGDGRVVEEVRSLSSFSSVAVGGSFAVTLAPKGLTNQIVVRADSNLIPLIITEVKNGQLSIGVKTGSSIGLATKLEIEATVTDASLALDKVEVAGSAQLTAQGIEKSSFTQSLAGSGSVTLAGRVSRLQADVSGSGRLLALDLESVDSRMVVGGSGCAAIVASSSLDATVSGSGSIFYFGSPSQVEQKVTGSGRVQSVTSKTGPGC